MGEYNTWRKLTARDLELFWMGAPQAPFIGLGDAILLQKALGDVSSQYMPEYFNVIYGPQAWAQFNTTAVTFGALPKATWPRAGWRVIKSLSAAETDIAISQTGSIPDPRRPEIGTVYVQPKVLAESFEVAEALDAMANTADVWGYVDNVRSYYAREFAILVDKQLVRRAIGVDSNTSEDPTATPYVNMLEPIDRIVSDYKTEGQMNGGTAGNEVGSRVNVYGIDRSTEDWANAVVLANNGTLRAFTPDLMTQALNLTRQRGAHSTMWLTGPKTYAALQAFFLNFVRYLPMSETKIEFDIDGVHAGIDAGIETAAVYGLPVVVDPYMPLEVGTDGNEIPTSLNRIYLLDTSDAEGYGVPRGNISVLRPVEYFESRDYILLNKFVIKGAYRFIGETTFRYLAGQAKIRDLQEG